MKDMEIDRIRVYAVGPEIPRYAWASDMPEQYMTNNIVRITTKGGLEGFAGAIVFTDFGYTTAIAETIRMGLRSGVKGGVLFKALHRSAADSRQLRNRGQRMIKRRYTNPVSAVTVLHKDINLGMTLAKRSKSITPIGSASLPFYDEALSSGYGELDSAVVYKVFEDREKKKKRSR